MREIAETVLSRQAAESSALYKALGVPEVKAVAIAIDAVFMAGFNQGIGAAALMIEEAKRPTERA